MREMGCHQDVTPSPAGTPLDFWILSVDFQLRDNAQKELKQIRDEVIDKKINATLVKKSLSLLETHSPNDT